MLPPVLIWNSLWSLAGGDDRTYTGNELSTEADQPSRMSLRVRQEPQTNSPSMAPMPSLTGVRGGGRLTCQCGSREPTSYANVARWQAEKSCLAVLRKTLLKLPPPPTTPPPCPQRPAQLTCQSLPCLWGCLCLNPQCPSPSPSLSLLRLNLWSTLGRRKQEELTTAPQAGAGTG